MMHSTCLIILVILIATSVANCKVDVPSPFLKRTDCGDLCSRVRCIQAKPEDCLKGKQVYVPSDGDCYCCNACINKAETPASIDKKCKADHCATIDCHDIPAKQCFDKGMAFLPKDNDCSCCDGCVPLE